MRLFPEELLCKVKLLDKRHRIKATYQVMTRTSWEELRIQLDLADEQILWWREGKSKWVNGSTSLLSDAEDWARFKSGPTNRAPIKVMIGSSTDFGGSEEE